MNVQDEKVELSISSQKVSSSAQRLEKSLDCIEDFLKDKNSQLLTQANSKNKDVILANLDVLISRMQDILQQLD